MGCVVKQGGASFEVGGATSVKGRADTGEGVQWGAVQ